MHVSVVGFPDPAGRGTMTAMDIANLMSFWAVSLLLVCTPGPDWAFVLGAAFRRRPILPALVGLGAGYLGLTIVVAAGLGALVARHPALLTVVTVLGALVLLRIGWSMFHSAHSGPVTVTMADEAPGEPLGGGHAVTTLERTRVRWTTERRTVARGAAVSGLNPKGLMLFIALLPQFVAAGDWPIAGQMVVLGCVFIVTAMTVYALLGVFAGRLLAGSERASRLLTGVAGGAMMCVAAVMLAQQVL